MQKLAGIIVAIGILPGYAMAAAVTFSDNFNRPDGPVGNAWTPWGNGADLLNGQLETFGQNAVAGGVGRALALDFPLTFGFDFRTLVPTGGGWEIGFNSPVSSNLAQAQIGFIQQCCGSSNVAEFYMTSGGQQFVNGTPSGSFENYSTTAFARISGIVNPDLSA